MYLKQDDCFGESFHFEPIMYFVSRSAMLQRPDGQFRIGLGTPTGLFGLPEESTGPH